MEKQEVAVALDMALERGEADESHALLLQQSPELCLRVLNGELTIQEGLERVELGDDPLAQVAYFFVALTEEDLAAANGKRRERLLELDDVRWLVDRAIRARAHITDERPRVFARTAPDAVANAYQWRAYRTVATVQIDVGGVLAVNVGVGDANGRGRATTYVAVTPDTCLAPWHQAYRVW